MKWLLGTYTGRFNRRHHFFGHLFSGRYKSIVVDERGGGYLRTACDYVHLNPVRAGLIAAEEPLSAYRWSSYPLYLQPGQRPSWLPVDRLLGAHAIGADDRSGQIAFRQQMEQRRREGEPPEGWAALRRGWKLGAADFVPLLAERLGRPGQKHELARERDETDEQRAERLVEESLRAIHWTEADLAARPKAHRQKVKLALALRRQTPMTRQWIAHRLHIGSASYVSHLTKNAWNCRL
jgi:hypothetical protein